MQMMNDSCQPWLASVFPCCDFTVRQVSTSTMLVSAERTQDSSAGTTAIQSPAALHLVLSSSPTCRQFACPKQKPDRYTCTKSKAQISFIWESMHLSLRTTQRTLIAMHGFLFFVIGGCDLRLQIVLAEARDVIQARAGLSTRTLIMQPTNPCYKQVGDGLCFV